MFDFFIDLDTKLFLILNGIHSPLWDTIMSWTSQTKTWFPLYIAVIIIILKKQKLYGLLTILFLVILVVLTDQISVHLFKNVFERLRPCHNPELQSLVNLVDGNCGGQYGFISSHAANCFGFAVFTLFLFRNTIYTIVILLWAAFVAYSRVYLGVHYPGDILVGAMVGAILAFALLRIYSWLGQKIAEKQEAKSIK